MIIRAVGAKKNRGILGVYGGYVHQSEKKGGMCTKLYVHVWKVDIYTVCGMYTS